MARETPTPSVSNLRPFAQSVRAAVTGMNGQVADAFAAIATALDQAQAAIETLEAKNRELASPDTADARRRSSAYVSGDRIISPLVIMGTVGTPPVKLVGLPTSSTGLDHNIVWVDPGAANTLKLT